MFFDSRLPPDNLFHDCFDLTLTTEVIGTRAFAHGGSSDIWRGIDRRGGSTRDVVVKVIRISAGDNLTIDRVKKRISREVVVWRSLDHKNILPFYGLCWLVDRHRDLPSLVYPYCEGGTCADFLKENADSDRVDILYQIANALNYLHTSKPPVVHGDIKASNILMKADGIPMLADFGLSRAIMELPTGLTTSSIRGSCRWMAPELFGDPKTDTVTPTTKESDVWAFGCLCLEVLWDTIPWASIRTDSSVMHAILVLKRQPTLPVNAETALGHIVQRCWVYEADGRPHIDEVQSALYVQILGEPQGPPEKTQPRALTDSNTDHQTAEHKTSEPDSASISSKGKSSDGVKRHRDSVLDTSDNNDDLAINMRPHKLARLQTGGGPTAEIGNSDTGKAGPQLSEVPPDEVLYCICNQVSFGEMIACDSADCPTEWFHLSCVGIVKPSPLEKWYCKQCRESGAQEADANSRYYIAKSGHSKPRRGRDVGQPRLVRLHR